MKRMGKVLLTLVQWALMVIGLASVLDAVYQWANARLEEEGIYDEDDCGSDFP